MGNLFFKYLLEIDFTVSERYEIISVFIYDEITQFGEEDRASLLKI